MRYKRGDRVSLDCVYGYEEYEGRTGTVLYYSKREDAYCVDLDLTIEGENRWFLKETELFGG